MGGVGKIESSAAENAAHIVSPIKLVTEDKRETEAISGDSLPSGCSLIILKNAQRVKELAENTYSYSKKSCFNSLIVLILGILVRIMEKTQRARERETMQ